MMGFKEGTHAAPDPATLGFSVQWWDLKKIVPLSPFGPDQVLVSNDGI